MKDQLYLLRPGFYKPGQGPLYCSDALPVEGMLSLFPQLHKLLDVHHLEYIRPRKVLVDILGEEYQDIPVLILGPGVEVRSKDLIPLQARDKRFFADERSIRRYLSTQYSLPEAS